MLFVLLSCLLLQTCFAYPQWIPIAKSAVKEQYINYSPEEPRTFSIPSFDVFRWYNSADSTDKKLDGLYEILKCMAESNEFSQCKTIVNEVKAKFGEEPERLNKDKDKEQTSKKAENST